MTSGRALVHVVDDDPASRQRTVALLHAQNFSTESWPCAAAFLQCAASVAPGCVVIDPVPAGLDCDAVQRRLTHAEIALPSVILTGDDSRALAIDALRGGAIDVLLKPADPERLGASIAIGLNRLSKAERRAATMRRVQALLDFLSPREREVLFGLTRGLSNKEIARDLAISARTVEIHRASVMAKLNADSLAQALRIAFIAEVCRMVNPALHVD